MFNIENVSAVARAYESGGTIKVKFWGRFATNRKLWDPDEDAEYSYLDDEGVGSVYELFATVQKDMMGGYTITALDGGGSVLYIAVGIDGLANAIVRRLDFVKVTQ